MNPILLWLAKQALEYAVSYVFKKMGYDDATAHIGGVLSKYTPLQPDPLPSPRAQQGPIEGHYGG